MKKNRLNIAILSIILPFSTFSMGIGELKVESYLNQPFHAEIPLIDVGNIPLTGMKASLASLDDFNRVGLVRNDVLGFLRFTITRNRHGDAVINIESDERITEPYLQLLVDLVWANGQLYRSYTILLDPPGYRLDLTKSQSTPIVSHKGNRLPIEASMAEPPIVTQAIPQENAAKYQRKEATYGPTLAHETVWQIAQRYTTPDTTIQQIILAILGTNSQAFTQGNLNGLKPGEQLHIPSTDEIKKVPDDLARQEIAEHDKAWKAKVEIKHVLLPPYINGVAGVSQFSATNNSLTESHLSSIIPNIPAFSSEKINSSPVNPLRIPEVVPPISYLPQTVSVNSAILDKKDISMVQNGDAQEKASFKTRIEALQSANTRLEKTTEQQNDAFKKLNEQNQSIIKEREALKAQIKMLDDNEPSSHLWMYLLLLAVILGGAGYWATNRRDTENNNIDDAYDDEPHYSEEKPSDEHKNSAPTIQTFTPSLLSGEEEHISSAEDPKNNVMDAYESESITPQITLTHETSVTEDPIVSPASNLIAKAIDEAPAQTQQTFESDLSSSDTNDFVSDITPVWDDEEPLDDLEPVNENHTNSVDFEAGLDKLIEHPVSPKPENDNPQSIDYAEKDQSNKDPSHTIINPNPSRIPTSSVSDGAKEKPTKETDGKQIDGLPQSQDLFTDFTAQAPNLPLKSKAALDTLIALAKTYFAMNDFDTAKQSLEEVLEFGDENQKKEAQRLIDEINQK